MKRRIYVDTSVIGGCYDPEFAEFSDALFDAFKAGKDTVVVSDLTQAELAGAPPEVRQVLSRVPEASLEHVEFSPEADELAREYLRARVVSKRQLVDAQHIALATLSRVEVLVSWNFKHIVNLTRIQGFHSVNVRRGLPPLEIRSPREVLNRDN